MKEQVIFVIKNKESLFTKAYKKVQLANGLLISLILVTKLYKELMEIEEKQKSKGE